MTTVAPDLVIFDVDGTLQDTYQWWPRVVRAAVVEFGRRYGVEVDLPTDDEACAVVGLADAGVWGPFLPSSHREAWRDLREIAVPLEVVEITAGRDFLYPETRRLLRHLAAVGIRTALASNCRSRYFAAVCEGQGLAELTDWQFCLDSNGGCNKTGMLRFAIEAATALRPVMVGDRDTDLEAARANGMPFVWRDNGRPAPASFDSRWAGSAAEFCAILGIPAITAGAER